MSYFLVGFITSFFYNRFVEQKTAEEVLDIRFIRVPLISILFIGFLYTIITLLFVDSTFYQHWFSIIWLFIERSWLVIPWFFSFHLYRFISIYQDRRTRTLVAEQNLKISQLEGLKKQLNPHFLFNALNSIKALAVTDGRQARESIIQLSDLLRLSLNLGEQQKATLSEEVRLAQNYLALEKLRFDSRLNYQFMIPDELENVLIMPMSLNTMLENAVKHGIGKTKLGGTITISAFSEKNYININVENTGNYDPKPKSDEGGIGLTNLRQRLELQYGEKANFTISNKNGNVYASIKMPY
jgi:LytS/YehU family sensor histidine kinase